MEVEKGAIFIDLTPEELCDLMCGVPEEDGDEGLQEHRKDS